MRQYSSVCVDLGHNEDEFYLTRLAYGLPKLPSFTPDEYVRWPITVRTKPLYSSRQIGLTFSSGRLALVERLQSTPR